MFTVCSISSSSTSPANLKRHLPVFHFSGLTLVLVFCLVLFVQAVFCLAQDGSPEPELLELSGDLRVHDPVMIRQGGTYYLFSTGGSTRDGGFIPIRCSKDLMEWKQCGFVFDELPAWAPKEIPGTRNPWAPDISHFNGRYHLYYSISTFGKNNSAIGLVTNKTLDAGSPDYKWEDQGMVLRSTTGVTDWNAIDPNLILEDEDKAWLAWGSFWGGIKMRRIDRSTGKLSNADTTLYSIASRPRHGEQQTPSRHGGIGAIEAPFIVKHDSYWYHFVSFDFCCRGKNSTYKIMFGRSEKITGPYAGQDGTPMAEGGGTLLLAASEGAKWVGPGHCAVVQDLPVDYLIFHAYDSESERSRSELKISTMIWENGWPRVAALNVK